MKLLPIVLALLILCACKDRAPPVAPSYKHLAAPVDLNRDPGQPMLPDLTCLQKMGLPCRGPG